MLLRYFRIDCRIPEQIFSLRHWRMEWAFATVSCDKANETRAGERTTRLIAEARQRLGYFFFFSSFHLPKKKSFLIFHSLKTVSARTRRALPRGKCNIGFGVYGEVAWYIASRCVDTFALFRHLLAERTTAVDVTTAATRKIQHSLHFRFHEDYSTTYA